MILNFWAHDNIEFYCINKHKKPVKMTIIHVKQIDAKVLDYSDSKIKIGIVNRRAIKD